MIANASAQVGRPFGDVPQDGARHDARGTCRGPAPGQGGGILLAVRGIVARAGEPLSLTIMENPSIPVAFDTANELVDPLSELSTMYTACGTSRLSRVLWNRMAPSRA
jgi:hypothetical protein